MVPYHHTVSRPDGMMTSSSGFHFDLQWGQTRLKIGKKKVEKITIPRVLSEMASVQKFLQTVRKTKKIELIRKN